MTDSTDAAQAADDLGDLTDDDYQAAAESMAQEGSAPQDGADDGEATDDENPAGRGQRYRERLRAAEAETTRLQQLVEGMRQAEIQRIASDRLADPADLFREATLGDMLDTEGRVDAAKLNALMDKVIAEHPHYKRPLAPYRGPLHSGATSTRLADAPSKGFAAAFAPPQSE
jgi:hypothetical protein